VPSRAQMSVKYPDHQPNGFVLNEADTCRKHVVPKLQQAGWDNDPHSITEQRAFTDGRIIVYVEKPVGDRANALIISSALCAIFQSLCSKPKLNSNIRPTGSNKDYYQILGLKYPFRFKADFDNGEPDGIRTVNRA